MTCRCRLAGILRAHIVQKDESGKCPEEGGRELGKARDSAEGSGVKRMARCCF